MLGMQKCRSFRTLGKRHLPGPAQDMGKNQTRSGESPIRLLAAVFGDDQSVFSNSA